MNQFYLDVHSRQKLKELRREGISGQELRRLGILAGPMIPQSAGRAMLAILLLGILLTSALLAASVTAAPLASRSAGKVCVNSLPAYHLGVDGGLTALTRGEISIQSVAASSARSPGVDGGLTGLRFARSEASGVTASAALACGGAPAGS